MTTMNDVAAMTDLGRPLLSCDFQVRVNGVVDPRVTSYSIKGSKLSLVIVPTEEAPLPPPSIMEPGASIELILCSELKPIVSFTFSRLSYRTITAMSGSQQTALFGAESEPLHMTVTYEYEMVDTKKLDPQ
ncbi:hypothetical protein [Ralstonia phage phiRSL1]|uniref:Uncharacterized protein n=1 Tax=Ralstonia phage phiRSL1 TaxID=1980924 RepID=B2ZYB9_9CAUD|nr:hypothetical protein RSL1_ORF220 [Ralstonia phage phiRSL1]BAG41669.1 hypothetical protein [Ralstonia phage phiRSL1]